MKKYGLINHKDGQEALAEKLGIPGMRGQLNPAGILSAAESVRCLDTLQLTRLEDSFRNWARASVRSDIRASRRRILLIFLLIRHTGARLNEILTMNLHEQGDFKNHCLRLGKVEKKGEGQFREVPIPRDLSRELDKALHEPLFNKKKYPFVLQLDPGHVRRKFYERTRECGFPVENGNPNAIRRSRAMEMVRSNLPLPLIQKLLGLSTPPFAGSQLDFSAEDIRLATRHFLEKEHQRKTSARNTFYGKIKKINKGDIQSQIVINTLGGDLITTLITNDSLVRLGLKENSFVTAEIKAPWVVVCKGGMKPETSAENQFNGTVSKILRGKITSEISVRLPDGTEMCSVLTEQGRKNLNLKKNDSVWVLFNSFSVIINTG